MKAINSRPNPELLKSSLNVHVGFLAKGITPASLFTMFKRHGRIVSVHVYKSKSKSRKNWGFVLFERYESAAEAVQFQNGKTYLNSEIRVTFAKPKSVVPRLVTLDEWKAQNLLVQRERSKKVSNDEANKERKEGEKEEDVDGDEEAENLQSESDDSDYDKSLV